MDGAEIGVLKEANHEGLGCLLEGEDGRGLEAEVGLEVLGDLTDEALEGGLADEEVGGLLVLADLAEGDGAGAVAVGLLDASGGGGGLAGGLGGELLVVGVRERYGKIYVRNLMMIPECVSTYPIHFSLFRLPTPNRSDTALSNKSFPVVCNTKGPPSAASGPRNPMAETPIN